MTFREGFDDNTHGLGGGETLAEMFLPFPGCFGGLLIQGGGELSQADMVKLSPQIKALELGFAPPQIRVVLMTEALKSTFSAAAKRIGLEIRNCLRLKKFPRRKCEP